MLQALERLNSSDVQMMSMSTTLTTNHLPRLQDVLFDIFNANRTCFLDLVSLNPILERLNPPKDIEELCNWLPKHVLACYPNPPYANIKPFPSQNPDDEFEAVFIVFTPTERDVCPHRHLCRSPFCNKLHRRIKHSFERLSTRLNKLYPLRFPTLGCCKWSHQTSKKGGELILYKEYNEQLSLSRSIIKELAILQRKGVSIKTFDIFSTLPIVDKRRYSKKNSPYFYALLNLILSEYAPSSPKLPFTNAPYNPTHLRIAKEAVKYFQLCENIKKRKKSLDPFGKTPYFMEESEHIFFQIWGWIKILGYYECEQDITDPNRRKLRESENAEAQLFNLVILRHREYGQKIIFAANRTSQTKHSTQRDVHRFVVFVALSI